MFQYLNSLRLCLTLALMLPLMKRAGLQFWAIALTAAHLWCWASGCLCQARRPMTCHFDLTDPFFQLHVKHSPLKTPVWLALVQFKYYYCLCLFEITSFWLEQGAVKSFFSTYFFHFRITITKGEWGEMSHFLLYIKIYYIYICLFSGKIQWCCFNNS